MGPSPIDLRQHRDRRLRDKLRRELGSDVLAALADPMGAPMILDESLLRAEIIDELPGPSTRWIANLRVSKLGGLLRSLGVADAASRRGVRMVVGAQVGETSVLTRAALPVGRFSRSVYQQLWPETWFR